MRVRHLIAGTYGRILSHFVLDGPYAGDLQGRWAVVRFDDGLECACPLTQLEVTS